MPQENLAKLIELRPGRHVFCRQWTIGTSSTKEEADPVANLICVNGTASSHSMYIPLLQALEAQLESEETGKRQLVVHCWMYDAIGCGESPALPEASAYCDEEQVLDLQALLTDHVQDPGLPTFFIGHSYAPNWIYKLLRRRQETSENQRPLLVKGLILVSSSLRNEKHQLQVGGPFLFKLPLWFLRCIQPILTQSFLRLGIAPATHQSNPQFIQDAKRDNNANDMKVVCHYYHSHDWTDDISDMKGHPALVLHGCQDQLIPIECGQDLANAWGATLVSINDASHMVVMEKPNDCAKHVLEFMMDQI